jgi:hypothetical protein
LTRIMRMNADTSTDLWLAKVKRLDAGRSDQRAPGLIRVNRRNPRPVFA